MAQVEFNYNGYDVSVQCNINDKMKIIFDRFYIKSGAEKNSVYFLYGGYNIINDELTFYETANFDDKHRNKMNITVMDKPNDFTSKNSSFLNNINYNPQNTGRPIIFQTVDNLNKKFDEMEKEIKQKSMNMRNKIDEMQNKLRTIRKTRIRFQNATYYGETLGGEATGLGILEMDDGGKYEGYFLDGSSSGITIYYGEIGDIFMGEYKNGKRIGFGIEENPEVGIYEGTWIDNSLTGTGILSYKGGSKYIGPIYQAKLSGFGKFIWPDGSYYIGNYEDDNRTEGKVYYPEEQGIFDAIWDEKEDETIAKGTFYFLNGAKENRVRIIRGKKAYWERTNQLTVPPTYGENNIPSNIQAQSPPVIPITNISAPPTTSITNFILPTTNIIAPNIYSPSNLAYSINSPPMVTSTTPFNQPFIQQPKINSGENIIPSVYTVSNKIINNGNINQYFPQNSSVPLGVGNQFTQTPFSSYSTINSANFSSISQAGGSNISTKVQNNISLQNFY